MLFCMVYVVVFVNEIQSTSSMSKYPNEFSGPSIFYWLLKNGTIWNPLYFFEDLLWMNANQKISLVWQFIWWFCYSKILTDLQSDSKCSKCRFCRKGIICSSLKVMILHLIQLELVATVHYFVFITLYKHMLWSRWLMHYQ